jgi:hypothetical protein
MDNRDLTWSLFRQFLIQRGDMADPTPNTHYAIPKEWLPIINIAAMILLAVAVARGWLTPEQASQIKTVIPVAAQADGSPSSVSVTETTSGTNSKITVTPSKPPSTDIEKRITVLESQPASSSIDWQQIWAFIQSDQGKQAIAVIKDILTPKPAPIVDPKPTPIDPIVIPPAPQPSTPIDGNPKLVVSDGKGIAITAVTIDTGRLFRVMLSQDVTDVSWKESAFGGTDVWPLPKGLGYDCQFRDATGVVEVTATILVNGKLQQLSARISALNSPMPPPVDPVIPDGQSDAKPLKVRKLSLAVVEDTQNRSAETAIVLRPIDVWNGFRDKGHDWRFYDRKTTEQKGKLAVSAASAIDPALVIRDLNTGELLTVVPLPKTIAEVTALVNKWSGA